MIAVSGLSKRFDVPILEDVSLQVPTGALLGLVGPGASGKSLLLKLIAGLVPADDGDIYCDGELLPDVPSLLAQWQQNIGMGFQNNALFDFMTVSENVAFPLSQLELEPYEVDLRVSSRLRAVGLSRFGGRDVSGLSGGQKKRVGVARATVTDAPFLLFDEPAAGLDPVTSQQIFDLLRKEQQHRGATCIMVSSDLDRLKLVCDRIAMLYDGEVVFEGSRAEADATENPLVRQFLDGNPEGPLR